MIRDNERRPARGAGRPGLDRLVLRSRRLALVAVSAVGLSGCTDFAGYDLDYLWSYIPFLSTMRGSVSYDPYEMPRLPAPNSVPRETGNGDVPPPFAQAQLDSAAATLVNPSPTPTPAELARGRTVYDRQCSVCHGPTGAGDGPVVGNGKYPFAPPVNSGAAAGRTDGYLYGIIAVGRGLMPPYGERISHLDRWAVVNYLRTLQRQAGVAPRPGAAPASTPATVERPGPGQPADTTQATGQGTQQQ